MKRVAVQFYDGNKMRWSTKKKLIKTISNIFEALETMLNSRLPQQLFENLFNKHYD